MKKYILLSLVGLGILGGAFYFSQKANADIYGSSLVGWWNMDSNKISGTTLTDLSGTSNTGTLVGSPVPVGGKLGQALSFNGTSQYVQTSNLAGITPTTPFSLSLWRNSASSTAPGDYLATFPEGGTFDGIVLSNGSNTFGFGHASFLFVSTAGGIEWIDTTNTFNINTWYHLVATYDGSQSIAGLKIYINGIQASVVTRFDTGFGVFPDRAWRIGTDTFAPPSAFFLGSMDDVRIYNRALSAAEIQQLYYQGFSNHTNAF